MVGWKRSYQSMLVPLLALSGVSISQAKYTHFDMSTCSANYNPSSAFIQTSSEQLPFTLGLHNVTLLCADSEVHQLDEVTVEVSETGTVLVRCSGDPDCAAASLPVMSYVTEKVGSIEIPPEEWKQVLIFISCFFGLAFLLQVFLMVCLHKSLADVLGSRHERALSMMDAAPQEEELSEPLLRRASSLSSVKLLQTSIDRALSVPLHARILVPLFVVATICTFLSANLSIGASVDFELEWRHYVPSIWPWKKGVHKVDDYGPLQLFEFSLANTVSEMYKAKVYMLALLVLCWSGIWPYLKLVLLLCTWYIPPRYLTVAHRERMLVVFDTLGKWCLMDVFLMTMMSVAFSFHIETAEIKYVKRFFPGNLVIDVSVVSHYGLFGFIVAAMLSLIMNHIILAYHRTALASSTSLVLTQELEHSEDQEEGSSYKFCCPCPNQSWFNVGSTELHESRAQHMLNTKKAISSHVFRSKAGKLRIGRISQCLVVLLLLVSACLILIGGFVESFEFRFTGIAGQLIGFAQPESLVRRYSMVTIAQSLDPGPESLSDRNMFGILFLQSIYLAFALVLPLVQVMFLLALWLVPMRLRDQKIVFYVTEMVSSWSALDVFIVSIIASVVQINQFAQFLVSANVGDLCDRVKDKTGEDCFGVETAFLPGCWILVAAATFLLISSNIVVRVCDSVIHDREFEALDESNGQDREAPAMLLSTMLRRASTSLYENNGYVRPSSLSSLEE